MSFITIITPVCAFILLHVVARLQFEMFIIYLQILLYLKSFHIRLLSTNSTISLRPYVSKQLLLPVVNLLTIIVVGFQSRRSCPSLELVSPLQVTHLPRVGYFTSPGIDTG